MADVQLIEIDRWHREKLFFHNSRRLVAKGNQNDKPTRNAKTRSEVVVRSFARLCVYANQLS